jgi:hypothetical protein
MARNALPTTATALLGRVPAQGNRREPIMIHLTQGNIRLNAQARDKTEAIRIAGSLLVDSGNMQPGYVDSMLTARRKWPIPISATASPFRTDCPRTGN